MGTSGVVLSPDRRRFGWRPYLAGARRFTGSEQHRNGLSNGDHVSLGRGDVRQDTRRRRLDFDDRLVGLDLH
jgi:hypothetical protein